MSRVCSHLLAISPLLSSVFKSSKIILDTCRNVILQPLHQKLIAGSPLQTQAFSTASQHELPPGCTRSSHAPLKPSASQIGFCSKEKDYLAKPFPFYCEGYCVLEVVCVTMCVFFPVLRLRSSLTSFVSVCLFNNYILLLWMSTHMPQ